jgi:hypothetical protein
MKLTQKDVDRKATTVPPGAGLVPRLIRQFAVTVDGSWA